MIERGKFRSLTLVNWNGFFARTFDLDELVTTLSGGNGAGKSTTMAAFVTARRGVLLGTRCDQLPPPARGGRRAPAAGRRARS